MERVYVGLVSKKLYAHNPISKQDTQTNSQEGSTTASSMCRHGRWKVVKSEEAQRARGLSPSLADSGSGGAS